MVTTFRFMAIVMALVMTSEPVEAQGIPLSSGGSDSIWDGTQPNSQAGAWLDEAAVSRGDSRRDLIIGAPGSPTVVGVVYILFGGPVRTGRRSLATADTIITGAAPGDRFGAATAGGNITNVQGAEPRSLLVAAPGVQLNRGAVYLFDGGFTNGTRIDTTAARLIVLGAPGDELGSTLATADLNNDGYRELILGAPANARVYVIAGSPTLSGTIDLASAAPTMLITGTDIGRVLAAGDVSGDGITDLLLGAAASNRVYVIAGGGTLSGVRNVPGGATAAFEGAPGDQLGSSIRVEDFDRRLESSGARYMDVLIGAPGNNRAYILWGTGNLAYRHMSTADVVIAGPAGYRIGGLLASGDITRDNPDDMVFVGRAIDGSADTALFLFYGRSRGNFGTLQPDNRRLIDLAGQANIIFLGDAGAGPILAAQVFEVTGEGARDVIAGVPDADGATGRVYFSLSPRLSISMTNITLTLPEAQVSTSATVQVFNPSIIPITWMTTLTAPWLSTSVGNGSASTGRPGEFTVTTASEGLAPGSYTAAAKVVSTSEHLEMTRPITVSLRVLAPLRLTASASGPIRPGQAVTWTAAADTSDGPVEYMFRRYTPASGWTTVQNYGSSNTFTWTPTASETGQYVLELRVRPVGSTAYEARTNTGYFAIGDAAPLMASSHKVDFDGDGRADPSVFRPSTGRWFARLSSGQFGASLSYRWGIGTDIPVPGDYDGDKRTDLAVFRPSNGTWYVLLSSASYASSISRAWGTATDRPVPADYDGDGRTDFAVFRPSNGTWYVLESSTNSSTSKSRAWGLSTDRLVPADYDGDGRADFAVFRPSNGTWYVLDSSTQYATGGGRTWGINTDHPVAGDYDGDGRADYSVYRPSNGTWYVLQSSSSYATSMSRAWGVATDVPVPADYNGDGRVDIAVFRAPSTWFVWSQYSVDWGATSDVPLLAK